jgi:hypothetical protein
MNHPVTCVPLVLDMFGLLFSNAWIKRWQKQWWQAHKRSRDAGQRRQSQGSEKPKDKKSRSRFNQRIFSLRVTLWYLIYQRLNFDATLAAVVTNLRAGGADQLGGHKKLSKRVRSQGTSGYNQARQRLPLELLQAALDHLRNSLLRMAGLKPQPSQKPGPEHRTRQLLDGSTLAMLLTPRLAKVYRPADNQNGSSDWCLMRIVVGFCARTGAVLSAIEGAVQQSEQALSWALMEKAAAWTIWIGDRNFGVWSVVAKARGCRQDVLVRLTKARAAKLGQGYCWQSGQERRIQWRPGRHDQRPPGTESVEVSGRLIYVRLEREGKWVDLWLFTTLDAENYPMALLVKWYGQRWQAELHFRSVKTQMKMAEIDVCSPPMARKEFYSALLAYSLVRGVMWAAGERLEEQVKALSFSQARRILLERLQQWGRRTQTGQAKTADQWVKRLLEEVSGAQLPKRRKKRTSEVRRVRRRRMKFPPLRGSRAAARAKYLSMKSA